MNYSKIRRIKKRERNILGPFTTYVLKKNKNSIGLEINMGGDICIDAMIYETQEGLTNLLGDLIDFCKQHEIGKIIAADVRDEQAKDVLTKKGFTEKLIHSPYSGYFCICDVMKEGIGEMV